MIDCFKAETEGEEGKKKMKKHRGVETDGVKRRPGVETEGQTEAAGGERKEGPVTERNKRMKGARE